MTKEITATVSSQNLVITPSVLGVQATVSEYVLKITFDEDWDNADTILVTFTGSAGQKIAEKYDAENGVLIPWEVLTTPGKVSVGAVGYIGTEIRLTTTGLYDRNTFVVLPEACGLSAAMTPTPDVYQKLVRTIDQVNGTIGNLAELDTDDKSNLVAAINEVLGKIDEGGGTVKSVNQVSPDDNGNVQLSPSDIGAQNNITISGTTLQL